MITGKAKLAGVLGWPIAHSLSPALHGFWIRALSMDAAYVPLAVKPEDFAAIVAAMPRMGFKGANVTLPHKEAALRLADTADDAARACGAANTLVFENGRTHAMNTDVEGFLASLDEAGVGGVAGERVTVLGAGGAARAIIHGLLSRDVSEICLVNRTIANAQTLATFFGSRVKPLAWEDALSAVGSSRILVNTTKLGMSGEPPLTLDLAAMVPEGVVVDIVYRPLETPLLAQARRRGLKAVDGLGMLLHQAVPGFEAWFGVAPSVTSQLRNHLVSILEGR
jgi:shikimate dehydrogenase